MMHDHQHEQHAVDDVDAAVEGLKQEIATITRHLEHEPGDAEAHFQRGVLLGQLGIVVGKDVRLTAEFGNIGEWITDEESC